MLLYRALVREKLDWSRVHLYQVDERVARDELVGLLVARELVLGAVVVVGPRRLGDEPERGHRPQRPRVRRALTLG